MKPSNLANLHPNHSGWWVSREAPPGYIKKFGRARPGGWSGRFILIAPCVSWSNLGKLFSLSPAGGLAMPMCRGMCTQAKWPTFAIMNPGVPHEWFMAGVDNCLLYGLGNALTTCAWLEGTMCALAMITGGRLRHIRILPCHGIMCPCECKVPRPLIVNQTDITGPSSI